MTKKRAINVANFTRDMKAGAPASKLMVKYSLTPKQFETVINKMRDRGLLFGASPNGKPAHRSETSREREPAPPTAVEISTQEDLYNRLHSALDRLLDDDFVSADENSIKA